MDNRSILSPGCVTASYTPQRMPQFKGNPLVEALPPLLEDEELVKALTLCPDFDPAQRDWSSRERLMMLATLGTFMAPMARHIDAADALDRMLRTSYVGRIPRTPEHAKRMQARYDSQKLKETVVQSTTFDNPQLSGLLMGISGMGKTTVVKRWCAQMPQVIYHPDLNLYQVPYIRVEMPSNGASVKGLATSILHQLDGLIPGGNYFKTYAARGRAGSDTVMSGVAHLMDMHSVGVIIADEVQNLSNSKKGDQTVMTELVSLCNTLGTAILFIGTNKASKLFSLDFRKVRRASGNSFEGWDRLYQASEPGDVDEWRDFLEVLWAYQWVRFPVELNELFVHTMYDLSQGIIDVAIKLFASAQARAIRDGTEVITPELLTDVYKREWDKAHPMLEALRNNDLERLSQFEDIAPVNIAEILDTLAGGLKKKRAGAFSIRPGDLTFVPRLAASLVATGIDEEDALKAAEQVAKEGKAQNLIAGAEAALKLLRALKPVPSAQKAPDGKNQGAKKAGKSGAKAGGKAKAEQLAPEPEYAADDYRSAILRASKDGTTVYSQLQAMGAARPLEELLELA